MEAGVSQMIALYKVEAKFASAVRPLIYVKTPSYPKKSGPAHSVYFVQPNTAFDLHLQVA